MDVVLTLSIADICIDNVDSNKYKYDHRLRRHKKPHGWRMKMLAVNIVRVYSIDSS